MGTNELYHYGVKDMRWGFRRFQNRDGTLTPAGKERYRKNTSKKSGLFKNAMKKKAAKKAAEKKAEETKKKLTIEEKKTEVLNSRSAKELYKNADLFTTQELQSAYNRLVLERNISQLSPKEVSKGKQFADRVISVGRTVNDVADVSMKTYNTVARLYNTFAKNKKNDMPLIKKD